MRKIVLSFPSREVLAEFLLACKIKGDFDPVNFTTTGHFDDECVNIAITRFHASIAEAPDFIIT